MKTTSINYSRDVTSAQANGRLCGANRKLSTASMVRRDLHQFFKDVFVGRIRVVPGQRLYSECFMCPFSERWHNNKKLEAHMLKEHIEPALRRHASGIATKLDTLLAFHYACVSDIPVPRLPNYDGLQVQKERHQFYFRHRSFLRSRDIIRPDPTAFHMIEEHVHDVAYMLQYRDLDPKERFAKLVELIGRRERANSIYYSSQYPSSLGEQRNGLYH